VEARYVVECNDDSEYIIYADGWRTFDGLVLIFGDEHGNTLQAFPLSSVRTWYATDDDAV
jgi:hypothetical protein